MSDADEAPTADMNLEEGSAESDSADDEGDDEIVAAESEGPASPDRYGALVDPNREEVVLHADAETYVEVVTAAKDDGFDQLIDLTAVDYLTYAAPRALPDGVSAERFEVVTQLINHGTGERIRIRVQVPAAEPVVGSLFDLWPGSEALEREVYDMFGIEFADHPDMSRVLMPDDWVGHPLRKDYAIGAIPVQFKSARNVR